MASEQGIVVKVGLKGRNIALVKTVKSSSCEACSSRKECGSSANNSKEHEVEAVNLVNAKEGDLVQISMDTQALLQATFLLYIFPILCMLIGAFAGHGLGKGLDMAPSALSLCFSIASFGVAMFMVRRRAGHMALKLKYQPKITRILDRGKQTTYIQGCDLRATNSA